MQVKKFEATSVIEALQAVKKELGPDAIILSTKAEKSGMGRGVKYIVVAAVSEYQLKKKELAEKKLGNIYSDKVAPRSAQQQKAVIENVYKKIEEKVERKNRSITQTRYIEIDDSEKNSVVAAVADVAAKVSGAERVKTAAQEAFRSSLSTDFFSRKRAPKEEKPQVQPVAVAKAVEKQAPPLIANMALRLKACGISESIIQPLCERAERELGADSLRRAIVDSWFAKWILHSIHVQPTENLRALEYFVGPHGAGKTTTLLKVATQYVVQQRKTVAIVTSDIHKVGAVEQLRVYSRILNIPVFIASSMQDLQRKVHQLDGYDSILIDTPGISLSNMEEVDFVKQLAALDTSKEKRIHLVISALAKSSDLGSILKRFRVAQFDDIVVSNIDQTTQHGILINIQEKARSPFHSFGIGADIVDGFEFATKERVLDLIFKLTKMNGEKAHGDTI